MSATTELFIASILAAGITFYLKKENIVETLEFIWVYAFILFLVSYFLEQLEDLFHRLEDFFHRRKKFK